MTFYIHSEKILKCPVLILKEKKKRPNVAYYSYELIILETYKVEINVIWDIAKKFEEVRRQKKNWGKTGFLMK